MPFGVCRWPAPRVCFAFDEGIKIKFDSYTIFDISPEIHEGLAVFPGDTPFSRKHLLQMQSGANLTLSSITSTVHLGAHTDAPNHYQANGLGISERSLDYYFGHAQVITAQGHRAGRVYPEHLADSLAASLGGGFPGGIKVPRVLIKTGSYPDPSLWNEDFWAFSPELIEGLAKHGVRLIGIDTPSIDPAQDTELRAHSCVARHDMAILEGIVLSKVPDGFYKLMALPLPIRGGDASPVRAVLWADKE